MKEFSKDDVLRSMKKAVSKLKDNQNPRYYGLLELTFQALAEEDPNLNPGAGRWEDVVSVHAGRGALADLLVEGYWHLVSMGYVTPEPQGRNPPNFNGIRITTSGKQWATGDEPSPEDQDGFLSALRAQVTHLDPIIDQYIQEAVAAYARKMYFASAVMVGAASEKTIYLMMDAMAASVKDTDEKRTIAKAMNERKIPSMLKILHHNLTRAKTHMPWSIYEGADTHLLSLQESMRVQRNDAVHPIAGRVTPLSVRLTLASFPGTCKKAYDLVGWFRKNQF